jgi:transposase
LALLLLLAATGCAALPPADAAVAKPPVAALHAADIPGPSCVAEHQAVIEIVRRNDTEPSFKVIRRRCVVERTFGWMTRWRRLVRDYEARLDVSHVMIHVAMGSLLLRRLAHQ